MFKRILSLLVLSFAAVAVSAQDNHNILIPAAGAVQGANGTPSW